MKPDTNKNPTAKTYAGLDQAYLFFNKRLFKSELPHCLITMQRHRGAYGYFAPERFTSKDGKFITDEIALNPSHFHEGSREVFGTLVHEMAHLWQSHFGKPSRNGYHNKEWGAKMHELGLPPSNTGKPGGKETGQRMSHFILKGGAFDQAYAAFIKLPEGSRYSDLYIERYNDAEKEEKAKKKSASKTCYTCSECNQKAWAKEGAILTCGVCDESMEKAA